MPVITSSTCPNGPANGTSRPNTAAVMIAAISAPQLRTCSEASKGPTANTVAGIAAGRSPPKPMNIAGHASTTTSTPAVTTAARSSQGARPSSHGSAACTSRASSPSIAATSLAAAPTTVVTAATTARASAARPTARSLSPAPAASARRGSRLRSFIASLHRCHQPSADVLGVRWRDRLGKLSLRHPIYPHRFVAFCA